MVWDGEFMPFGEALTMTGSITNNLRFPGQYFDEETGFNYNYFRDYNPVIGRYIQADPIGIKQGENHLYGYVANNPVNKIDPKGEMSVAVGVVIVVAVAIAVVGTYYCMNKCMECNGDFNNCRKKNLCDDIDANYDANWNRNFAQCSKLCTYYANFMEYGIEPIGAAIKAVLERIFH